MSTIRLKKDHAGHKAAAIISVPFGKGRDMIREGIAELVILDPPPKPPAPAALPSVLERHAAEIANLNAHHATALADVRADFAEAQKKAAKEHAAALAKLQADLDAANALITELNSKQQHHTGKK